MPKRRSEPQAMRDPTGYLKAEEIPAVLEAARCERDRLMMELMWVCMPRPSELLLLEPRDIEYPKQRILFEMHKRGDPPPTHYVACPRATLVALKAFIRRHRIRSDQYIFHGRDPDRPMNHSTFYRRVRGACERAGYERIGKKPPHPYHLRHSGAVDFYRRTKDIRTLQLILGHKKIETTIIYIQVEGEELQEDQMRRWLDQIPLNGDDDDE